MGLRFAKKHALVTAILAGQPAPTRVPQWAQVALALAAQSPQTVAQIRQAVPMPPMSLRDALQTACVYGLVRRVCRGQYAYIAEE